MRQVRSKRAMLAVVAATLMSSVGSAAFAQTGAGDGFLFRAPQGSLSLRMGFASPSASSKVFSFASERLTLNHGDFAGFSAAVDLDVTITRRLALQLGTAISARDASSEYRDFIDNNDLPIEQVTSFRRAPITAGLKYALVSPGRSVGKFAWVPRRVVPYVGGGGGFMYYSFRQSGDFVDFQNFDVFPSTLESSGWSSTAYGSAGVTVAVSARMGVITEARYDHSRAFMGTDFQGFDRIDLSGLSLTTGLHLRF